MLSFGCGCPCEAAVGILNRLDWYSVSLPRTHKILYPPHLTPHVSSFFPDFLLYIPIFAVVALFRVFLQSNWCIIYKCVYALFKNNWILVTLHSWLHWSKIGGTLSWFLLLGTHCIYSYVCIMKKKKQIHVPNWPQLYFRSTTQGANKTKTRSILSSFFPLVLLYFPIHSHRVDASVCAQSIYSTYWIQRRSNGLLVRMRVAFASFNPKPSFPIDCFILPNISGARE